MRSCVCVRVCVRILARISVCVHVGLFFVCVRVWVCEENDVAHSILPITHLD